ncbi:MAG TPA: hypothetical protein DCL44_10565 [Elusimicrobia bacterium]|nr:hypothetical protein [Elusimicrobiota bacterium]
MKLNDKVLVFFLVSVGIFSATQAKQYIASLSTKGKNTILSVAKKANSQHILLCSGVTNLSAADTGEGG